MEKCSGYADADVRKVCRVKDISYKGSCKFFASKWTHVRPQGAQTHKCPKGRTDLVSPQGPTQSVCVADSYFMVNVLELPFASPIAIYC